MISSENKNKQSRRHLPLIKIGFEWKGKISQTFIQSYRLRSCKNDRNNVGRMKLTMTKIHYIETRRILAKRVECIFPGGNFLGAFGN